VDQDITKRVRERAYHIWVAHGGDADRNWLQAETEILQATKSVAPISAPRQKLGRVRKKKSLAPTKIG
jgi:hypothetical protein